MRRLILVVTLMMATLAVASPAEAFWHHRWCWGWRWGFGCWGPRWGCYRVGWGYYPGCWTVGMPVCYGPCCGSYTIGATVGYVGPAYGFVPVVPARSSIVVLRPAVATGSCGVPPAAAPESRPKSSPAPAPPAAPAPSAPAAPGGTRGLVPSPDLVLRGSIGDGLAKARRLVEEGDLLFRRQQFHSALQKYKQAVASAPALAEVYWRQGHALVAVGEYERAATTFKRALALSEELDRGGFRLSMLYGSALATKEMHLERLAEWTLAHARSPEGYFLLGLMLHFDGQPERAEKFLLYAGGLSLTMRDLVAGLLSHEPGLPAAEASDSPRPPAGSKPPVPVVPVSLPGKMVEL